MKNYFDQIVNPIHKMSACMFIAFFFIQTMLFAQQEEINNMTSAKEFANIHRENGYKGIWYMVGPNNTVYKYKYSGGLATYCAKHKPFAVYAPEVNKTFFCYGGAREDDNTALVHMVSFYDHETGMVPKPVFLLDKETGDAHDNPVISIDAKGYVWIFSTSHGTQRPSYIHRSAAPYSIDVFEKVHATRINKAGEKEPFDNFSYLQVWPRIEGGYLAYMTHYNQPAIRTIFFGRTKDGVNWDYPVKIAAIEEGHYQVSYATPGRTGSAFNFHPSRERKGVTRGINSRTNLYYVESYDEGKTWQNIQGEVLSLPLTEQKNPALVHDYWSEGLTVYMKDIQLTPEGQPVIFYLVSPGAELGPENMPRVTMTARWNGTEWIKLPVFESDNNYDTGSLYIESSTRWRVIAPSDTGPQPYNPGGEIAMWVTEDAGQSWTKKIKMTSGSDYNHGYVRRPVNAQPDFYGFWADGDGRKPSDSRLYYCNREGEVFQLPVQMQDNMEAARKIKPE